MSPPYQFIIELLQLITKSGLLSIRIAPLARQVAITRRSCDPPAPTAVFLLRIRALPLLLSLPDTRSEGSPLLVFVVQGVG